MQDPSYDLLILGGGPGGIEAALMGAQHHLKTALITDVKLGGRAVWGSLVPSKVWLTAAEAADALRHGAYHALGIFNPHFDLESLRTRIVAQSESASARYRQALQGAEVEVFAGKGLLTGPNSVLVQPSNDEAGQTLSGRYIIIATGSEPAFTPTIKPLPPRIFAPRHTASLSELPKSLLVIGGGVTGVEYAYAFATLGVEVILLHNGTQILPRIDSRVATVFEHQIEQRLGIRIRKNDAVRAVRLEEGFVLAETERGQSYRADYAFLGTGRRADLRFYDPAALQFDLDPSNSLTVNTFCQTNYPNIYAAGDVTGLPMMANKATMQARVAVTHLLGATTGGFTQMPVAEMTYTHPPIGQIGEMAAQADAHFVEKSYASLLKAHLDGETAGMLRIKVLDQSGLIAGAAAFGPQTAELLGMIQVAMQQGIPYHKLRAVPLAHPSYGELLTIL